MSTMMMATGAAPATVPAATVATAPAALKLVTTPTAPVPAEVTFLQDHPLMPIFIIGAIAAALSLMAVGSIVFWLAIRYSGVLAP